MSPTERAARFGVESSPGSSCGRSDILDRLRQGDVSRCPAATEGGGRAARAIDGHASRACGRASTNDADLRRRIAPGHRGVPRGGRPSTRAYRALAHGRQVERARESLRRTARRRPEARERAFARSDEGIRAQAQKDRATRREERDLNHRYEQNRASPSGWRSCRTGASTPRRRKADAINGAFGAMGRAFSDHLTAVVEGREELGVALQGCFPTRSPPSRRSPRSRRAEPRRGLRRARDVPVRRRGGALRGGGDLHGRCCRRGPRRRRARALDARQGRGWRRRSASPRRRRVRQVDPRAAKRSSTSRSTGRSSARAAWCRRRASSSAC